MSKFSSEVGLAEFALYHITQVSLEMQKGDG